MVLVCSRVWSIVISYPSSRSLSCCCCSFFCCLQPCHRHSCLIFWVLPVYILSNAVDSNILLHMPLAGRIPLAALNGRTLLAMCNSTLPSENIPRPSIFIPELPWVHEWSSSPCVNDIKRSCGALAVGVPCLRFVWCEFSCCFCGFGDTGVSKNEDARSPEASFQLHRDNQRS